MNQLSLAFSFAGGVVSFLSPCVLPIIPGFLAYLAGASFQEAEAKRKEIFLHSVFFVLGFSVVFAILGVILNSILKAVAADVQIWLSRIARGLHILLALFS